MLLARPPRFDAAFVPVVGVENGGLADAPQRRGTAFTSTRTEIRPIVGERRAHVVQQEIRVRMDALRSEFPVPRSLLPVPYGSIFQKSIPPACCPTSTLATFVIDFRSMMSTVPGCEPTPSIEANA